MSESSGPQAPSAQVQEVLQKGFLLLRGKLMKSASVEFQKALGLDPQGAKTGLGQQFARLIKADSFEEALNLGRILLELEPKNYVILNHLGNCARHLKLREQADRFYRLCYQIKPDYTKAHLNFGANGAKLEAYDQEVEEFLARWIPVRKLRLPTYQGDPDLIETVKRNLAAAGKPQDPATIQETLAERVKTNWRNSPPDLVQNVIQSDNFNFALFAFENGDFAKASEIFCRLSNQKSVMPEVATLCALSKFNLDPSDENFLALEQLRTSQPYNRALNQNLGITFLKAGKPLEGHLFLCNAARLLSRSQGLYRVEEILAHGDDLFLEDRKQDALGLYEEACLIQERPEIRAKMGDVYRSLDDHDQALVCYQKMRELDPNGELTRTLLQEVHDGYLKLAETAMEEKKFQNALADNFRAEKILRQMETLKQRVRILGVLNRNSEVDLLQDEINKMRIQKELAEIEARRQALILQGKQFYRAKDYLKAAKALEDALSMKKDKDVFMLLAGIYKGLKHTRALNALLFKWKSMPEPALEVEEEEDKQEKEEEQQLAMMGEIESRPQLDLDF